MVTADPTPLGHLVDLGHEPRSAYSGGQSIVVREHDDLPVDRDLLYYFNESLDLRGVHRLNGIIQHDEPERAFRRCRPWGKNARASACNSPWLITPNTPAFTPPTSASSSTRRVVFSPVRRIASSPTLLSCRRVAQISLARSASGSLP